DYAAIYGSSAKDNGTQTRYCKITAYDGAKRYPVEGESTADDELGNSTSTYYLRNDIYTEILANYTTSDVYKMLNNNYLLLGENRSANTVSTVKNLLESNHISQSNFSLNPENNPIFFVNGKNPLPASGINLASGNYDITNGSSVVVEVGQGLDNIPLNKDSLRPYLLPCGTDGVASLADTEENRIYLWDPDNPDDINARAQAGNSYKFTVELSSLRTYSNNKHISVGQSYLFGVAGSDTSGNAVVAKENSYGFYLTSNGAAPGLTVTSPLESISFVGANGSQTFSGIVTCQDGTPTITITGTKSDETSETVYSHTFTISEGTSSNGVISYPFTFTKSFNGVNTNDQIQYSIVAAQNRLKTTVNKTLIYDKDAPNVEYNEPSPLAAKYDVNNEDSPLVGENYLNGQIELKVSISDDYDSVDTDSTHTNRRPYFEVLDVTGDTPSPLSLVVTGDVETETTDTDKHYITKLINAKFQINTESITDNKHIKFRFHAWDRSGNEVTKVYPESSYYIVDQSTDLPVVLPNDNETSFKFKSKAARDTGAGEWTESNQVRRSQVSSGGQLIIKMLDDDGLKSWEVYRASLNPANETEEANTIADNRFVLDSSSGNSSLNNVKELTKSITVQSAAGYYWYKIKVKDKNDEEKGVGPFIVKVTTAAPSISVSALSSDVSDASVGLYVGAAGAAKTKWKNKIEIDSSEDAFALYLAINPTDSSLLTNYSLVPSSEITWDSGNSKILYHTIDTSSLNLTGNQSYYYYVRDTVNVTNSSPKKIECKFDGTAPILTITSPGENAKTGTNAINASPYQFRGSVEEANNISAIYYKLLPVTDAAPATPSSWEGWTSVTPEAGWSFYRDVGSASGAIAEGKYKIYMYALDIAGNLSTQVSREFHVDLAAPVVTASAPQYVNASTNENSARTVTISGTVTETHGLASFYIKRNDEDGNGSSVTPNNGNWTYTDTPTADGTYTYTITTTDLVGKTNTSLVKTVT
ncbi:MAG: hypothetical protein K6C97_08775, partial [Treponema sp.]|nr:hypothetical protein [Treponema sp.]